MLDLKIKPISITGFISVVILSFILLGCNDRTDDPDPLIREVSGVEILYPKSNELDWKKWDKQLENQYDFVLTHNELAYKEDVIIENYCLIGNFILINGFRKGVLDGGIYDIYNLNSRKYIGHSFDENSR